MSLVKAYNIKTQTRPLEVILGDFKEHIEGVFSLDNEVTKQDAAVAVSLYAEYSLSYLVEVANTFKEPKDASQTMRFMNSFLAEMMHLANLRYFELDKGYSIVDKAVQITLDHGAYPPLSEIITVIDEIEASYAVEDEAKHLEEDYNQE